VGRANITQCATFPVKIQRNPKGRNHSNLVSNDLIPNSDGLMTAGYKRP
jgi:hypothetical protein